MYRSVGTAVVTGATSFIGSAVCSALLARGATVYGLVRPSSTAKAMLPVHPGFHVVLCELKDVETWAKRVGKADTFFHFAWGGPGAGGRADRQVQQQSADITLECMRGAALLGVSRFFFSGSQAEYGRVSGIINEDTPCSPVLEYGISKLRVRNEAPAVADKLRMEYVHARYFSVYGPNDHPYTLVPSCIRAFLRNETIELSECRHKWNFMHVDDAAEATVRLAECELTAPCMVVNVASTDTRVLKSFLEEIQRLAGGGGYCAYGARKSIEQPTDNWPDIHRLQQLTGWVQQVSFAEGVGSLIELEKKRMAGEVHQL